MSDFSGIYKNIKLGMVSHKKKKKIKHPETKMNFSASYFHSSFFLGGGGLKSILKNNFTEAWYINKNSTYLMFSSVSQSCPLFANPWTAAHQASLFITNCQNLLKLMPIKLVMPSNHFILCHPLFTCLWFFPAAGLFQWVSSSHWVVKVLEFQLQHKSFQWILRTDFF